MDDSLNLLLINQENEFNPIKKFNGRFQLKKKQKQEFTESRSIEAFLSLVTSTTVDDYTCEAKSDKFSDTAEIKTTHVQNQVVNDNPSLKITQVTDSIKDIMLQAPIGWQKGLTNHTHDSNDSHINNKVKKEGFGIKSSVESPNVVEELHGDKQNKGVQEQEIQTKNTATKSGVDLVFEDYTRIKKDSYYFSVLVFNLAIPFVTTYLMITGGFVDYLMQHLGGGTMMEYLILANVFIMGIFVSFLIHLMIKLLVKFKTQKLETN